MPDKSQGGSFANPKSLDKHWQDKADPPQCCGLGVAGSGSAFWHPDQSPGMRHHPGMPQAAAKQDLQGEGGPTSGEGATVHPPRRKSVIIPSGEGGWLSLLGVAPRGLKKGPNQSFPGRDGEHSFHQHLLQRLL